MKLPRLYARTWSWRRTGLAAKVRHDSRVHLIAFLPSLMYLLAGAALVVEGDDALGRPCQVGDNKADARVQLARMPLDLGHDAAQLVPALRLIGEADVVPAYFLRHWNGWNARTP